jgi:hypothetical protein
VTPYADYGLTRQTAAFTGLSLSTLYTVQVVALDASGNQFPATFQVLTSGVLPVFKGQWTSGISYSVTDLVNQGGLYGCTVATSGPFSLSNWLAYPGFLGVWKPSQNYSLNNIVVNPEDNKLYVCVKDVLGGMLPDPSQQAEWSPFSLAGSQPFPISRLSSSTTDNVLTVEWSGGSDAVSYLYKVTDSSDNVMTYTLEDDGLDNNASFTGLPVGTYTVLVTAVNSHGSSNGSVVVTVVGNAPSPLVLSTTVTAYTGTVTWTGGGGVTVYSYALTGGDLSGNMAPTTDNGLASKSITYTGLTLSTSYTVTVTATNPYGSVTATASFTTLPPPFQGSWTAGRSYALNDVVVFDNVVYIALTATNEQTFTSADWSANSNPYGGVWTPDGTKPVACGANPETD